MIGKRLLEERAISNAESRAILEKKAEKEELDYEQKTTLDHLKKFSKLTPEKSEETIEELMKSNEKIKRDVAVKIVDLLPKDADDVKAIFAKERFALSKEEVEGILKIVSKL